MTCKYLLLSLPFPHPSKMAKLGFWFRKMRNVLKRMKNTIFRFLSFEKCSYMDSKYLEKLPKLMTKKCQFSLSQKMHNVQKRMKKRSCLMYGLQLHVPQTIPQLKLQLSIESNGLLVRVNIFKC